ncbi:unnamed protein product [Soboliphyme baturini]|uniref:RRM domain-containing protein n=1 Tax=Soboliphyme baturini TaxID=241478 RepID=A0A183J0F0_9BILA|nr:unnamed protein product [Soboliphyme baturini]
MENSKLDLANGHALGILNPLSNGGDALGCNINGMIPTLIPQQALISGFRKDCIRLRGLPYEAQVHHILDFLGTFAKNIVFQGVHMVYNAQGHPSGEAFIQMDSEAAANAAAKEQHNKYLQIGKKHRYIEVFQCSADEMNLFLTSPAPLAPSLLPSTIAALSAAQNRLSTAGLAGLLPSSPGAILYWPYPTPPVSPTNYFASAATNFHAAVILMRGLTYGTTVAEIVSFFRDFSEITSDVVQIQRNANGQPTGDALVLFSCRSEAERAVLEKNHHLLGNRPVELYLCGI